MTVRVPKLHTSHWKAFCTAVEESLSCMSGKNDILLSCIIRESKAGNFHNVYASRSEKLKHCMKLSGSAFCNDNSEVYSLLLQHTEKSEGYSIVEESSRTRNGRKPWKDLLSHIEGSTYKE